MTHVNTFQNMIGRTMRSVTGEKGGDLMDFESTDGSRFSFYHSQDCCESVSIEDICGDLDDLVGSPIVLAEAVSNEPEPPCDAESFTWTFYRFGTAKGTVTVRWLGTSNGYYSEGVAYNETLNDDIPTIEPEPDDFEAAMKRLQELTS